MIKIPTFEELDVPAKEKFFIKLFLYSGGPPRYDDESGDQILLLHKNPKFESFETAQVYCSKVESGERLSQILAKEMLVIAGKNNLSDFGFKVTEISDDGFAPDKHGNQIKRWGISLYIPRFEAANRQLLGLNMSWVPVEQTNPGSEMWVDYSHFPYKISERPHIDWEGLGFQIDFNHPLNMPTKQQIEELINHWFDTSEEKDGFCAHFISDLEWNSENTSLKWWVDMGSEEIDFLDDILSKLSDHSDLIKELVLGR